MFKSLEVKVEEDWGREREEKNGRKIWGKRFIYYAPPGF